MGVLNLVHELMHSFGAKHDPDAKENKKCTPDDKVKINVCINYDITICFICRSVVYYWIQLTIVYLGINLCAYILFRDGM